MKNITNALNKILAVALLCGSLGAGATPLNTNIIVNGNAEASAGAPNFGATSAPSSWTVTSNFSAVQYAAGGGGDLNSSISTAVGGGNNYFAGGPSNAAASAQQLINVADLAAAIDGGGLGFAFSALIGGFATQDDNMVISAIFLDAGAATLGTQSLGPVTQGDRGGVSNLLLRSVNGFVPVGTRSIEIDMQASRLQGSYNDGYADNLSLLLAGNGPTPTPIPGTLLLLGAGLIAMRCNQGRTRQ